MSQFYEGFWLLYIYIYIYIYIYLTMYDIISYIYAINNLVNL
jgi:hypothetical protein